MICLSDDTGFFLRFTVVLNGYPCAACMVSSEIPLDTMQRTRQRGKGMLKKSKRFTAAVLAAFLLAGLLPTGIRIQAQEALLGQGATVGQEALKGQEGTAAKEPGLGQGTVKEGNAQDVQGRASGDYEYVEKKDGTLELTRYLGDSSVIAVPDTIDGKAVTSLGDSFSNCRPLYAVAIGANISQIGPVPFSDAISLKYISVDSRNPYYASRDGILYSKDMAELIFCPLGLEGDVAIPEGVSSIGRLAFGNCHLLTGVAIPEGVVSIGEFAFGNCISLAQVDLPASVAELGNAAFSGCSDLAEVKLSAGNLTQVTSSAFSGCGLERITIPEGVEAIGASAFQSCGRLSEVAIPESVSSIGDNAFLDCKSLLAVNIPKNVGVIGGQAFQGCASLTAIEVDGLNQNYASAEGILYSKDMAALVCCPAGKSGDAAVAAEVKKIEPYAFFGCAGLTGAALPEGVESIGMYAFSECSGLREIALPDTVSAAGASVFQGCGSLGKVKMSGNMPDVPSYFFSGCGSLREIVLPENIGSIGMYAFQGCSMLPEIRLPAKVGMVDPTAWEGCGALASIVVDGENPAYDSDESGVLYKEGMAELVCCPPNHRGMGQAAFTVPEGVASLGAYAFYGCRNLEKVELAAAISEIGEYAFGNCSALEEFTVPEESQAFASEQGALYNKEKTSLICWPGGKSAEGAVFPETLEHIGFAAFFGSGVGSIAIPGHVKMIGQYAFADCAALTEITLHSGTESIGEYAFRGCGSLGKLALPSSLAQIGPFAFSGCGSLTEIVAEDGNAQYASEDGTLYDAGKAEVIYCPEGKAGEAAVAEGAFTIGHSAFADCGKLEKLRVPESILYIRDAAFSGCSADLVLQVGETSFAKDYAKYYRMGYEVVGEHNSHENKKLFTESTSCTSEGEEVLICASCGLVTKNTVPPSGHTEVMDEAVPGTCIQPGKTEGSHCAVCGQVLKEQEEVKGSHTEVKDEAVPATCAKPGKTEGSHCSVCNQVLKAQKEVLGSHKPVREPAAQPNCTNPGNTMGIYCSVCGKILTQMKEIPALGHDSKTTLARATTQKDGKILVQCKRKSCMAVERETVIYAAKTIELAQASYVYNGKPRKPSVIVKDSQGTPLKEKQDYKVSYGPGRKNVGTYTVTITLQGNYVGIVEKTFDIVPKGTSITKITPLKKGFTVKWKKQAKQTTGYQIAYSTNSKFKKKDTKATLVKKNKTSSKSIKKKLAKKKYYVKIRTWKTVEENGKTRRLYSSWSKVKTVRTK